MNALSRNSPIALVVGAAGFLGSHLVESLLSKNIQVVGVDNLSSGKKEYLEEAIKNRFFHFLNQSASLEINISLPRLDYAVFLISCDQAKFSYKESWDNFIHFCQNYSPKILLVSSLDLYDPQTEGLTNLKETERSLALLVKEKKLNARVVRLCSVFGPRMHFKINDPMFRLIEASLKDNFKSSPIPLDFTTRSLYIADAVNLLIKAMLHGGTNQQIYDGAPKMPVKVSEVRQILIDPIWHEMRGFLPTPLPPWPSPNLEKTEKELSWQAQTPLVKALKETLRYFKEKPERLLCLGMEEEKRLKFKEEFGEKGEREEKKNQLEKPLAEKKRSLLLDQSLKVGRSFLILFCLGFFFYILVYPLFVFTWHVLNIPSSLQKTGNLSRHGDFAEARISLDQAKRGVDDLRSLRQGSLILTNLPLAGKIIASLNNFSFWLENTYQGEEASFLGSLDLNLAWRGILGEEQKETANLLIISQQALTQSLKTLRLAQIRQSKLSAPFFFWSQDLAFSPDKEDKIKQSLQAAQILAQLVYPPEERNYLFILEDNRSLNNAGGKILALAKINFKNGKLGEVKKEEPGLVQKLADLDLNKDQSPDFNLRAQKIIQLDSQESGKEDFGLIAIDLGTFQKIMQTLKIEQTNTEVSGLWQIVLNKIIFLPKLDWNNLADDLSQAEKEKHLQVYFTDPLLASLSSSWGLSLTMPWPKTEVKGEREEFLALSENDLGKERNLISRRINLQSSISQEGTLSHFLTISYLSSNQASFQLKTYLSAGSKLLRANFGGEDILKKVGSFADFGRAGYIFNLSLPAQEEKKLILEYQDAKKINLSENLQYSLYLFKQADTGKDKFSFQLDYPDGFQAANNSLGQISTGAVSFSSELNGDLHFSADLQKRP